MNKLNNKDILSNPILKTGFENKIYQPYLEIFTANVNQAKDTDVKIILYYLIRQILLNCGISLGYRTVMYDVAYSVLKEHPEVWNEQELLNGNADLENHWTEFYPEYDGEFDNYDVTCLNSDQYFNLAIDMLLNNDIETEYKPVFSYAVYLFFRSWGI